MRSELVGQQEKHDICSQVDRILRDLGNPDPPLDLANVRTLLSLDLKYYSSTDIGLIAELTHRFQLLAKKAIPDAQRHLVAALSKANLCAFWLPDSSQILIDTAVPEKKHRWIEAHEIAHSITEWHKHFLLGDNSQTLDPLCHATIEAEANYGAGRLLFLQDRFSKDAKDLPLNFGSIINLSKRYSNSIISTFWRAIEDRNPEQSVFGITSVHPNHPTIGAHNGARPWKSFIRSDTFKTQFPNIGPEDVFGAVTQVASERKTGLVAEFEYQLVDINATPHLFDVQCYSTGHALLTLGVHKKAQRLILSS